MLPSAPAGLRWPAQTAGGLLLPLSLSSSPRLPSTRHSFCTLRRTRSQPGRVNDWVDYLYKVRQFSIIKLNFSLLFWDAFLFSSALLEEEGL